MRAQHHGELADLAGMNKVTAAHRHAPPVPAAVPTPQPPPAATAAKGYPALPPLMDEAVAALVHTSPAMLPGLVAQYGSPLHLIWPQRLQDNVRKLVAVLQSHPMPFEIFYGAKVNKSPALVRAAVQAGIGVDVSSLYEAADALRAGADPTRLCATGPAKTRAFHKLLLDNTSLISIDSLQELQDLDHCLQSAGAGQRARVLLRYRPQALAASRFGMDAGDLCAGLARLANPEARLVLEGFHFHLSGYAVEPRVQAVRELLPWVHEARRMGLNARMLDIGGGLPIRYVDTAAYSAFLAAQDGAHYRSGKVPTSFYPYGGPVDACMWMEQLLCSACTEGITVAQALHAAGLTLAVEPGRSLVDQAAISVFRATRVKPLGDGRYVIFVEGSSFSACETWFGSEFLVDPLLVPGDSSGSPSTPPQACHAYIAGHSCLDDDVLTHRWISFARVPQAGDLLVYANTAGYQMDLLENEFHRHPMPRRIAVTRTAAGGMAFSPDDDRTE